MIFFVVVAITMGLAAMRLGRLTFLQFFHRTLHLSSQLPVRICMLLLTFLMTLAGSFVIEAILGAFSAGMVVGTAARGKDGHLVRDKLHAIGFGYFVPILLCYQWDAIRCGRDCGKSNLDAADTDVPDTAAHCTGCTGHAVSKGPHERTAIAVRVVSRDRTPAGRSDN